MAPWEDSLRGGRRREPQQQFIQTPRYHKFRDGARPQIWMGVPPQEAWRINEEIPVQFNGRSNGVQVPTPPSSHEESLGRRTPSTSSAVSKLRRLPIEGWAAPRQENLQSGWSTPSGRFTPANGAAAEFSDRATPEALSQGGRATPVLEPVSRSRTPASDGSRAKAVKTPAVQAPWGSERANTDQPDWGIVAQRQNAYRQILDEQNARKAAEFQRRREETLEQERSQVPSLSTSTHEWGAPACDVVGHKALMLEHVAIVAHRKGKEKMQQEQEQTKVRAWMAESDRERAERWLQSRQRQKEEVSELTNEWKNAAEERRLERKRMRQQELNEEKEAAMAAVHGMKPERRLRKPPPDLANIPATAR
mmetsp:Transcript_100397/g.178419  ORF Transcript_100397/g.178419 Transcript_100397/m.178419 type:complete len:364 (+) Transcript_100397:55-1146(+)